MFKTKWLNKRQREKKEKKKLTAVPPGRFAGALYHDDAPRDFGPAASDTLSPTGSEGGTSRPLDHMRQIPFVRAPQFHRY